MSLNTVFADLAYYKEFIAVLKRIEEAVTQLDKLLNKGDNKGDKDDSTLNNKEAVRHFLAAAKPSLQLGLGTSL